MSPPHKGVEKQAPTPVNFTVSKGQLDSQNKSQKEKENNQDQSSNANSTVKLVDINIQVPQSGCNLGDLSGLINIHFHFK